MTWIQKNVQNTQTYVCMTATKKRKMRVEHPMEIHQGRGTSFIFSFTEYENFPNEKQIPQVLNITYWKELFFSLLGIRLFRRKFNSNVLHWEISKSMGVRHSIAIFIKVNPFHPTNKILITRTTMFENSHLSNLSTPYIPNYI